MKTFKIIDNNALTKRRKNQADFLVLPDSVIARSGILQYGDVECQDGVIIDNGNVIPVLRPAGALKACYKQFANLPLTLEHPESNEVNPDNARGLIVGSLASNPRYEERNGEGFVICDIFVYDAETIRAIDNNEYEELSAGYETAFRAKRGKTKDGIPYEAEQFFLSPNHVALVKRGRCGNECKICDHAVDKKEGEQKMARKKKIADSKKVRWFLNIVDGGEAVEISEEDAKKLQDENPDLEVEEANEEDIQEEGKVAGIAPKDNGADEDPEEDPEDGEEDDEDMIEDEDGSGMPPKKEDEDSDFAYEVQFDDGTIGRMDENTYKQIQRFLDVSKTGDAALEAATEISLLTAQATRILGDSFDISSHVRNKVVDTVGIKKAIIRKVMPKLVTKNLKGDSLDRVYKTAVDSAAVTKKEWTTDVIKLGRAADASAISKVKSPFMIAREKYIANLNGKTTKEEEE